MNFEFPMNIYVCVKMFEYLVLENRDLNKYYHLEFKSAFKSCIFWVYILGIIFQYFSNPMDEDLSDNEK